MSARAQIPMKPAVAPARPLTPSPFGTLQRKCACGGSGGSSGGCEECKKKTLQRRAATTGEPATVPPIVHDVLRSPGRPLDAATRSYMEPRFGYDFGSVRVHGDSRSAASAQAVNALAYTVGDDVVFGSQHYAPQTVEGQRLLAHELTHTIQQSQAKHSGTPVGGLKIGAAGDAYEREADAQANRLTQAPAATATLPQLNLHNTLQRQADPAATPAAAPATGPQPAGKWGQDVTCREEDLRSHIWPGDALAKTMLNVTMQALASAPTQPVIEKLLKRYFMSDAPDLAAINRVFSTIKLEFAQGGYLYSCREDCASTKEKTTLGATKVSWLFGPQGPTYLCMNTLRPLPVSFTAATILHEFCHRYANLNSVDIYCDSGCPPELSAENALKNPDSYAQFASDVYFKSLYVPALKGALPKQ